MKNFTFPLLILSILLPISSSSLLFVWVGLEANTILFIYLVKSSSIAENLIKYFLIQEMGSAVLIASFSFQHLLGSSESYLPTVNSGLISLSIIINLGAAPFHHWIIQVGANIPTNFLPILLSIQKLAPLLIINPNTGLRILIISSILSGIIGSVSIMLAANIKSLIVLSSIAHLGWLILSTCVANKTLIIYILTYTLILVNISNELTNNNSTSIPPVSSYNSVSMVVLILSLAGIPPTIGFIPNLIIIHSSTLFSELLLTTILLIFFSVVSAISYIRVIYNFILNSTILNKMKENYEENHPILLIHLTLMPFIILITQSN